MPLIRPLRALRYGTDVEPDLGDLISPARHGEPVDRTVVGDVHELNVRQLVRGDRGPLATDDEPPFTHAARLLDRWKQDGVLTRDPRPAMYVYGQRQEGRDRMGLVCLVRLADYEAGIVLPHEATRGGSTTQLAAQLGATDAQLSMVMAVVPDASGALGEYLGRAPGRALMEAEDGHGRLNAVWRDEDPASHLGLIEALRDEVAVIADGHHRYEAALRHRAARAAATGSSGRREHPWDYVMMLLVPAAEPGLRCEPTHRVCPALPDGAEAAIAGLDRWFEGTDFEDDEALLAALDGETAGAGADTAGAGVAAAASRTDLPRDVRFAMVGGGRRRLLVLRDDAALPASVPDVLREVDAAVLEALVLDRFAPAEGASGSPWGHNASSRSSVAAAAAAGDVALAFLLRPTPPGQVVRVAAAGALMPPKSTNFAPKPAKGLLVASLKSF